MKSFNSLLCLLLFSFLGNATARSKISKMPIQPIKLYYLPPSPPCRAVMMTAKLLDLELELVVVNLMEGDHMKPEFVKMNPQHTIPVIDDAGFILAESRAIMTYLVSAYGKDDSFYPKNPRLRALVDSRLYFDSGTLFPRYGNVYIPMIFSGAQPDAETVKKFHEALGMMNHFLEGKAYVAGDNMTLADVSIVVVFTNIEAFEMDFSEFENIKKWFHRMKLALEPYGYNEIDVAGAQMLASFLKQHA